MTLTRYIAWQNNFRKMNPAVLHIARENAIIRIMRDENCDRENAEFIVNQILRSVGK
jgi:hypothetical protein